MRVFALVLALTATSCGSSPSAATINAPSLVSSVSQPSVSGTVWLHARDGVRPYAKVPLGGVVTTASSGTWVWGTVDENGHYSLPAPDAASVRVEAAAGPGSFQPCEVMLLPGDRSSRDVHVVEDTSQLGAHLPAQLAAQTPTLSGIVYEIDESGRRVPLQNVSVSLDTDGGMGWTAARTLTDPDGRYVLCGLAGETLTYVLASKAGYELFGKSVPVTGNTTLDIQLRR